MCLQAGSFQLKDEEETHLNALTAEWVTWAEFSGWGRAGDSGGQVQGEE